MQMSSEIDGFNQAIDTFRVFCGVILWSFAKHSQELREEVIRNFIARGMICTQNIYELWKAGSEQDAWILHRSLVDRLFHLHFLAETNSFSEFEEFSFLSTYEARSKLFIDPNLKDRIPQSEKDRHKEEKTRYDLLCSGDKPRWHRPKAKDMANQMGLGFLYEIGYDYASRHVHPLSDDGAKDFITLTTPPLEKVFLDSTIVTNSILTQSLIVQEAFDASKLQWRGIVYKFVEQLRESLNTDDLSYMITMREIAKIWPSFQLCK